MSNQNKKILIIEDEQALIKNLELALRDEFEVLAATTGGEGIKKAKTEKPDLILLDIMLPDQDGDEVLKELKKGKETDDIPVIIMTNLGNRETISKILDAGGKEYIVKSDWSIGQIVEKIKANL